MLGTAEAHRTLLEVDWGAGKGGLSWMLESVVKPCCSSFEGWTVFFVSAKAASCAGIKCTVWAQSGTWAMKHEDARQQNQEEQEGG